MRTTTPMTTENTVTRARQSSGRYWGGCRGVRSCGRQGGLLGAAEQCGDSTAGSAGGITRAGFDLPSSKRFGIELLGEIVDDGDRAAAGSLGLFLEPADRDALLALGVRRSFAGDELLLRQGDPTDHVLVLVSGWVRIYSDTSDGHEILVALRGPGDVVGDLAALNGWSRMGSVRTLERVTAVLIRSAEFVACLHARPTIAIAMIKQLSERLREAETARVDIATLDVTKRVASYLLRLVQQHGVPEHDGLALRMPLTQQDIGNSVGASRRAVARSMAILRERGVVHTSRQRIVIARPDVLALFGQ